MELHCMRHCLCPFKTQGELILRLQNVFTVIQLIWSILSIHFYVCDVCICFGSFYHLSFYPGLYPVALSDTACPHRDVFLENHNMCRNSTISKKIFETSKSTLQPQWFARPSLLQVEQVRIDTDRTSRLHKYLISIVALQCSWHSPIHIRTH